MKSGEYKEDFINQFLHLFYEFPVENFNYNFISENFQSLILLTLKSFEYEPSDDVSLPAYVDHETPQICEEEPTIPFFFVFLLYQYQFGCLLAMMLKLGN